MNEVRHSVEERGWTTSAKLGLVSLIAILFSLSSMDRDQKSNEEDAKYAKHGVITEGVVLSQTMVTEKVGRKKSSQHNVTHFDVMVAFKTQGGQEWQKTFSRMFHVEAPSAGKPTIVKVIYLPQEPFSSAKLREEWDSGTTKEPSPGYGSILMLIGGLTGMGIACYKERDAFKRLVGL